MDLIITILPVVTKDLPISPRFTPYHFFYRDASSALLQLVNQRKVEFYLLAFPRFPLRKKEHNSYFGKNRTHDFRTSRCAAYLLDHSGDERHCFRLFAQAHSGAHTKKKYINIYRGNQQLFVFHFYIFVVP